MMINTELELMQASSDAEQDAAEVLEKFMVEWLGKRGQQKAQAPQPQQPMMPQPQQMPQPGGMSQVTYG
jgi:hypothetical protein